MDDWPLLLVLMALLVAAPAAAHVPGFPGENSTPSAAFEVDPATKSWAFYDSLASEQTRYYDLHLDAGDRLFVSAFTPHDTGFAPSIAVMHPSFETSDPVPDWVTVPDGHGVVVIDGARADSASFEPFTPASLYETSAFDQEADPGGHYLVAIFDANARAGQVGIAIGTSEEFSFVEYFTVPLQVIEIHQWEGDHPVVLWGPLVGTLLVAAWLTRTRDPGSWRRVAVLAAGALILGTALGTLVQLVLAVAAAGFEPAALLTVAFVVIPGVAGTWLLARGRDPAVEMTTRTRVVVAIAGLLAAATWAGLLVGPALALLAAAVPHRDT